MKRYALIALMLGGCMSPVDEFRGAAPASQTVSLNVPAGAGATSARSRRRDARDDRPARHVLRDHARRDHHRQRRRRRDAAPARGDHRSAADDADRRSRDLGPVHRRARSEHVEVRRLEGRPHRLQLRAVGQAAQRRRHRSTTRSSPARRTSSRASSARATSCSTSPRCTSLDREQQAHGRHRGALRQHRAPARRRGRVQGLRRRQRQLHAERRALQVLGEQRPVGQLRVRRPRPTSITIRSRVQETVAIKSVWLSTGQGKSNVGATGGSLAADATLEECWNTQLRAHLLHRLVERARDRGRSRFLQAVTRARPAV